MFSFWIEIWDKHGNGTGMKCSVSYSRGIKGRQAGFVESWGKTNATIRNALLRAKKSDTKGYQQ